MTKAAGTGIPNDRAAELAQLLLYVGPLVGKLQNEALQTASEPLTLRQYRLLRAISGGGRTLTGLKAVLVGSFAAISQAIDGVEARGLVTRAHDERDARRRVLTLTPRGRRALREAEATIETVKLDLARHLPRVTDPLVDDMRSLCDWLLGQFLDPAR